MTVGKLKKALEPFEDEMHIIVVGHVLDEDGDEAEAWFAIDDVTRQLDQDTAEEYARFLCGRLEDFRPDDGK